MAMAHQHTKEHFVPYKMVLTGTNYQAHKQNQLVKSKTHQQNEIPKKFNTKKWKLY